MTSIIISSDAHETCQMVGEKTADALGYKYIGRELLEQVAEQYNVSADKLLRVLNGSSPRKLSNKSHGLLLGYIQTATLEQLLEDSIVCAGLAAHLYVRDVSHVLMIHVLSDPKAMVNALAVKNKISAKKASKILERERARRVRWSMDNFGIDEGAPSTYDMVISLEQIEIEKVVDIIKDMAGYRKFQPMTYSRKHLQDLALASKVRVALLSQYPDIRVSADGDTAIIHVKCSKWQKQKTTEAMKEIVGQIAGVKLVQVHAVSNMRDLEKQPEQMSFNDQ
jgi:cytidylate kinase